MAPERISAPAPDWVSEPAPLMTPESVPVPEATLMLSKPAKLILLEAVMVSPTLRVVLSDISRAAVPRAELLPTKMVPAVRDTVPLKLLAPVRERVAAPFFVRVPAPVIVPE